MSNTLNSLDIAIDTAAIVEADGDGVTVVDRDGITVRLDARLVDRIVAEQNAQKQREANMAALGWSA